MRLKGVQDRDGGWLVRIVFGLLRLKSGSVPEPMRIYAYVPSILRAFGGLARTIRKPGTLPGRLKGLAMYWTARTVQCSY